MTRRWTLSALESSLWRDVCNLGAFKKSFLPSVIDFTISWTRQNAQLVLKAWGQIECVSQNIIFTCSYLIMAGKIQNKALKLIDIWHCLSRRCIIIIPFTFLKSTLSQIDRMNYNNAIIFFNRFCLLKVLILKYLIYSIKLFCLLTRFDCELSKK